MESMGLESASRPYTIGRRAGVVLRSHRRSALLVPWAAVTAVSVGLFIASLPPFYSQTLTLSAPHTGYPEAMRQSFHQVGMPIWVYATVQVALLSLLAGVFVGVGALIYWRKPDSPTAAYFSLTLITFGAIWPNTMDSLATEHPALRMPVALLSSVGFGGFFIMCYLFPSGRFVPRWTRWLALVFFVSETVVTAFPGSPLNPDRLAGPAGTFVSLLVFPGTMLLSQVWRYWRVSTRAERQQTKWVVFSLLVAIAGFVGMGALGSLSPFSRPGPYLLAYLFGAGLVYTFGFMLVPLSIGVAVLRYRLWDIDPIINRTLVYGALTVCVVGVYVILVGYLGALFRTGSNLFFSLVAAGVVAVLFQALREKIQAGVNRLMYGDREEPYRAISRLGQRLEAAIAPEAVLPSVVETVKEALKLPYAAVALGQNPGPEAVTELGQPSGELLRVPLVYQHEAVGELRLSPRSPGEGFSPADRRLLDDLARQVGMAAHAVRLTADLQRSREGLVTAREEERRRLRRDLHDGLGAQLAALNVQAGVIRNLIRSDPDAAGAEVNALKRELKASIADIRRLVNGLRPPALDELGLVGAINRQAAQYQAASDEGEHVQITVEAPPDLPPLPAAIEVAVYRIAQEALTNVLRHSGSRRCMVRLTLEDGSIRLEIRDDGRGIAPDHSAGVGLVSLRERAQELGGGCEVSSPPDGGTRVLAHIPLQREQNRG